ncbi:CobW family GTP-binding protein [Thiomicrorhabdus cannonii]|uniref:CobW family GTP-binding protein n=1 Tax=Thiomicrorhabdus cannonii TaxID=2748011 RepID=UPI0015BA7B87|nr:GTP-binding protein [Thiomicrorhabdus cannonii]
MPGPVQVNLICGPLGSGKTSLIRHLLTQKPANENWTLLVNEFGAAGIDGAIFDCHPSTQVFELPGGCICCSAQGELKNTLHYILTQTNTQRLLIEPTGLGEPDSIVDLLRSLDQQQQLQLQTLFSVFDAAFLKLDEVARYTVLQNLMNMADVIVLNKQDLANATQLEALSDYCRTLYPPKKAVVITRQGEIDASALLDHVHHHHADHTNSSHRHHHAHALSRHHDPSLPHLLPFKGIDFGTQVTRKYKFELGVHALGYIFAPEYVFDWKKVLTLFQDFTNSTGRVGIKRAKGVFRVGNPWMLFQWSNGQVSREYIAYRRDSRIELLIEKDQPFDFTGFETALQTCLKP